MKTPLETFTNKTMSAALEIQNGRQIRFEVLSKDSSKSEIIIKLLFHPS
jgi:hypothetical protein